MGDISKRFNIFGFIIVMVVGLALFIQFSNFNKIHMEQAQSITLLSRDFVGSEISSQLMEKAKIVTTAADYVAAKNWGDDELTDYLTMLTNKNPSFSMIYLGKPSNEFINGSVWAPKKFFDLRISPGYIKALVENRLVFTEVFPNIVKDELIVTIAKPVYTSSGELLGVMAGDVSIENIIAIVQNKKISEEGYSFIIDGDGNILAHPYYKYDFSSEIKNINEISKEASMEMKQNEKGLAKVTINGTKGFLAYQKIENTDWRIGSFVPLNDYVESGRQYFWIFGITLVFSMFFFGILILLERKYFLKPIIALNNDIQDINVEQDITFRIPELKKDPFAALRKSINSVLDKTQEFFSKIEAYDEELIANNNELEASLQQLAAAEKELWEHNEQLKISEQKLEYLSYHDQLTGLYNRRFFSEELERLDVKSNYPLTIIMGDVNGLKLVNDSFGHAEGDVLLVKTAEAIRKGCRANDVISRIGGDEFVILLPKTDTIEAERIVKRIKAICLNERVASIELSISFGWETKLHEEEEVDEIYKKAEDYLYKRKLFEGPRMRSKTISAIISTLHEKNKREEQHSLRVSVLCENMGKALALSDSKVQELRTIGLLHDIGKIAINENTLNKPDKLTAEEREEINKHTEIGYRILSTSNDMAKMAEYVLYHHERWDGGGYPKGLRENEIPIQARILAIVDAYDAITSDRPYRSALPIETAIEELRKNAGTQFDPVLVEVFVENIKNLN